MQRLYITVAKGTNTAYGEDNKMARLAGKYGSLERNKQLKELATQGLPMPNYTGTKDENLRIMKFSPPVPAVVPAPTLAKPIPQPYGPLSPVVGVKIDLSSKTTTPMGTKIPAVATAATPHSYFQTALKSLAGLPQKAMNTWKDIPSHIKTGVIAPLALGGIAAAYANKNPDVSSGIVTGMGHYYDTKAALAAKAAANQAELDRVDREYGYKFNTASTLANAEFKKETTKKAMEGVNELVKGGQLPSDEMLIAAGAFGDKERYRNIAKNNANLINRNIRAPYHAPVKSEPTDDELLLKEDKQTWANFIKKNDTMEKQRLALSEMSTDEATRINEIHARLYGETLFTTTKTIIEGKSPNIFSWYGTPEKTETKVTMVSPQVEKTSIGKVPAKKEGQPSQKVPKVKVPFVPNIKYYTDKQGRKAVTLSQTEYDKHEKEIDDYTTVYIDGIAYTHRKE